MGVVGSGRGLRMILNGEGRDIAMPDPLDGSIIEIDMRDLYIMAGLEQRVRIHDEAVVL